MFSREGSARKESDTVKVSLQLLAGAALAVFLSVGVDSAASSEARMAAGCTGPARLACPASSKDTLVIASGLPVTLDADFTGGQESSEVYIQAYSSLLYYKSVPTGGIFRAVTGKGLKSYVPWLASSLKLSADKRTWTVTLRRGVRSHYGNELTTADIRYTIQRKAANKALGAFVDGVAGVSPRNLRILDRYRFSFRTPGPNFLTPDALALMNSSPIDSREARKHATPGDRWSKNWLARNEAGFGPYRVVTFEPGRQVVLERFDDYWGPKPSIRRIIYRDTPETANRLSLLRAGQVDIAKYLTPQQLAAAERDPNLKVQNVRGTQLFITPFNLNRKTGPLGKRQVRLALNMLANQALVIRNVYLNKYARPWRDVYPDFYIGYTGRAPWSPNVTRAKQLLAQAGYPNGGFTVNILTNNSIPAEEQMAIILRDSWKRAGVNATIDKLPPAAYEVRRDRRDFDVFVDVGDIFIPDTRYFSGLFYESGSFPNYGDYRDSRVDKNLEAASRTVNPAQRLAAFKRNARILQNAVPWVYMPLLNTTIAMRKNLMGYVYFPENHMRLAHFYFTG